MPECSEPASELGQFANTEFTKNELIECFLLCCQAREMLVSLVRQRHLYASIACGGLGLFLYQL